jgi:hypothetical protein
MVSSQLEKFKWKDDDLANCRCKICGDSSQNKNKARGYFFSSKDTYFYKCHNCGVSLNLYSFLEQVSPALAKEYNFEKFKDVRDYQEVVYRKPEDQKEATVNSLQAIEKLPSSHKARLYLDSRRIPRKFWSSLAYSENFSKVAEEFDEAYKDKFLEEDRLIIKIEGKNGLCGIQGRSFDKNSKMKYITLKKNESSCYFNYSRVDTNKQFFILEGPFDSMFVSNGLATLGLSKMRNISKEIDDSNAVYILDNQPYNIEVVSLMDHLISQNKKVCIFPKSVRQKDINEMVLANLDVYGIIMNNIYDGLRAKLVFNKWKKI